MKHILRILAAAAFVLGTRASAQVTAIKAGRFIDAESGTLE